MKNSNNFKQCEKNASRKFEREFFSDLVTKQGASFRYNYNNNNDGNNNNDNTYNDNNNNNNNNNNDSYNNYNYNISREISEI